MSMLEQQAFQQPMPLWQENSMTWVSATMVGTTGLLGNGISGWDMVSESKIRNQKETGRKPRGVRPEYYSLAVLSAERRP